MTKRILTTIAALGLALGLAGAAHAAEAVEGTGQVRGKDLLSRTVTVQNTVYSVARDTVLLDEHGNRLTLEQLPVAKQHLGGWVLTGDTLVDFEARVSRSGAELRRLQATGRVPR